MRSVLCDCVAAILKQSTGKFRVLIIDNASLANTAEIASGLLKEDREVTFVMKQADEDQINRYDEGFDRSFANYMLILSAEYGLLPGLMVGGAGEECTFADRNS